MDFSKQEMELFLPLLGLWSKNFFYKMFLIWSNGLQINFQNKKWNSPNRKRNHLSNIQAFDQKTSFTKGVPNWFSKQETELSKQEKELYLSHFRASDQKTSFTRCFPIFPWSSKFFKSGGLTEADWLTYWQTIRYVHLCSPFFLLPISTFMDLLIPIWNYLDHSPVYAESCLFFNIG